MEMVSKCNQKYQVIFGTNAFLNGISKESERGIKQLQYFSDKILQWH